MKDELVLYIRADEAPVVDVIVPAQSFGKDKQRLITQPVERLRLSLRRQRRSAEREQ